MISIVIPAYNESTHISSSVRQVNEVLADLRTPYEILVVNDGSTDGTMAVLNALLKSYEHLRIVSHEKNKGPGAAFRTGFRHARGDIIVTLDADLSFSPKNIPKMLQLIKNADVVLGSQHMRGARMENIPLWRIIVSKVAVGLDRLVLGINLTSLSSFFVAYRRSAINSITISSDSFDAQCEILFKLYKSGFGFVEFPCDLIWSEKRKNRLSFAKLLREVRQRVRLWLYLNKWSHETKS